MATETFNSDTPTIVSSSNEDVLDINCRPARLIRSTLIDTVSTLAKARDELKELAQTSRNAFCYQQLATISKTLIDACRALEEFEIRYERSESSSKLRQQEPRITPLQMLDLIEAKRAKER
jgi:hypothetical protein